VAELLETSPLFLPVDLIPLGLGGGTAGQQQQAAKGENTQEQGHAPDEGICHSIRGGRIAFKDLPFLVQLAAFAPSV
jgi:hypothetical protein